MRSYNSFLLLAALPAVASLGVTILGLSQADDLNGLASTATALLISAAITAIVGAIVTVVLQFTFRSVEGQYERLELLMSWVPLFLLHVVVLDIMAGLLLWSTSNFPTGIVMFCSSVLLVWLNAIIMLSFWARRMIKMVIDMVYLDNDDAESVTGEDGSDTATYEDEWPRSTPSL
jgi:hypothetical protein